MKRILLLSVLTAAFWALPARAQNFVIVSGTVHDPSGNPYINCTLVIAFVPAPTATQAPTIGGQPFNTTIPQTNCNAGGYFITSAPGLANNALVVDGHAPGQQASLWSFRFCTGAGITPLTCFTLNTSITGPTPQDITAQISGVPPPSIGGGGGGGGQGPPGLPALMQIGTVTTVPPNGTALGTATATVTGPTGSNTFTLNLGIPGGVPGTGGGGIVLPSGALPGDNLLVGANSMVIASPPGLTDSSKSPVTTGVTPSCGGVVDSGDRSQPFVLAAGAAILVPHSGGVCASAVFYFAVKAQTIFTATSGDNFDIFNGAAETAGATTYTASAGQYLTVLNGSGTTWRFLVGFAGSGTGGTTYTANPPLNLTGTAFGMIPGTANGNVLTWNGTTWNDAPVPQPPPTSLAFANTTLPLGNAPVANQALCYDGTSVTGCANGTPGVAPPTVLPIVAYTNPAGNNMSFYTGQTVDFTPKVNGEALITFNATASSTWTTSAAASISIQIYKTTGTLPAIGTAISANPVLTLQSGYLVATSPTTAILTGGIYDTGLTPGTRYHYYIGLNSVGATGVATLNAGGTLQIAERPGGAVNPPSPNFTTAARTNGTNTNTNYSVGALQSIDLTPATSGNAIIAVNMFLTGTSTTTTGNSFVTVWRTTAAVPAANTILPTAAGETTMVGAQTGIINTTGVGVWVNAIMYDTGLTVGTTYHYFLGLNNGASGTVSLAAGGTLQVIEDTTIPLNQSDIPVVAGTATAAANMNYSLGPAQSVSFTPATSSEALVSANFQMTVTGTIVAANNTGAVVQVLRTTGTVPAAGTVDTTGNPVILSVPSRPIIVATGVANGSGAILDTGLTPGTAYTYYLTLSTSTGSANTVTNTGRKGVQITERVGLAAPSTTSLKPMTTDGIQFVSPLNGMDSNDGLSWGSAKQSIAAAYAGLPAGGGTITIASTATMPTQCLPFTTTIALTGSGKPVTIRGVGAEATILCYTGPGPAMTVDTGTSTTIEDLYLEDNNAGNTATGILVGPTNGCNKCSFLRVNLGGFHIGVDDHGYGTLWNLNQIACLQGDATSIGFEQDTSSDDTRISDAEIRLCNNGIYHHDNGTMWVNSTVLWGHTVSVNMDGGGNFYCVLCHWYNPPAQTTAANWLTATTGTNYIVISNSSFDTLKTAAATLTQFMTVTGGTFVFQNNLLFSTAETVTRFVTFSTAPAVTQVPGNSNNVIKTLTTIPAFSNVAPPANMLVYQ